MRRYLLPGFLVLMDMIIVSVSFFLSLAIRFKGAVYTEYLPTLISWLPILIVCYVVSFFLFRVYSRIWRYAGLKDLFAIIASVVLGMIMFRGMLFTQDVDLPRSLYILTFFFILSGIAISRICLQAIMKCESAQDILKTKAHDNYKNVLIIGAGDAANILAREISQMNTHRNLIGFIDDDVDKWGQLSNGKPIFGGAENIASVVTSYNIEEIIIAMPSQGQSVIKKMVEKCSVTGVNTKILPAIYGSLVKDSEVRLNKLRPINIEDLLQRDSVQLELDKIAGYLTGKVVLVTGAGGSIGSEICRQVMKMKPEKLILLGRGENSIYEIHRELLEKYDKNLIVPIIANVTSEERLRKVFKDHKPQVVFHAAAHKHVPLMESQPKEAILNNVFGSWNLGKIVGEAGVERLVAISTDKAVNPTSVMGATKRVMEKIMMSLNNRYPNTTYVAVRFGNVLGSRGSVVPLFKKQIAKGGPLTVTDPEMKRYFMIIPEAAQLVLQAGSMGKGGEVFVLDMGSPVKIVDLAINMIKLSGLEPYKDIDIKFTGLRPGEKLFEELLTAEEGTDSTTHKQIFRAKLGKENSDVLRDQILVFKDLYSAEEVIKHLKVIIPTYTPNHFDA